MKWLYFLLLFALSIRLQAQQTFDSLLIVASEEVYFDFGKAEIRADADSTLQVVVEAAADLPRLDIKITAHTDAVGDMQSNQLLSQKRAQAVKDTLGKLGLPDSLIQVSIFGESRPVAENTTDEGRQRNRRATIDIQQWTRMARIEGRVVDPETHKGIHAEVVVRRKMVQDTLQTDTSGTFAAIAPVGSVVGVDVFAEGYFFETQMLKMIPSELQKLEIPLKSVRSGASVDMKNMYFYGGRAVLLERSESELPKLLKFMQINPGVKIEVAGHVNVPNQPPVSEASDSYRLSVARALLIYNYLLDNNVPSERLTYEGYGNWEMRFPRARSQREQELNRRVEIKVLETGKVVSEEEPLEHN